ncbi:MAG: hypothetical protein V4649_12870 [Bacteroidota bacterium]
MRHAVFVTAAVVLLSASTQAQTGYWGKSAIPATTTKACKVGGSLTVGGGALHLQRGADTGMSIIDAHSNNYGLALYANGADPASAPRIQMSGLGNAGQGGISFGLPGGAGKGFNFMVHDGSSYVNLFTIGKDGNAAVANNLTIESGLTVGTTAMIGVGGATMRQPAGYSLYVSKGILTEKLKVANSGDPANWSDFVFAADYKLPPLNKVESYIQEHKHLPEIPSAAEVAKDGIDVMEMDAKLLQKIEELTLYVIQQQKEIDELKKQVGKLKR